MFKRKNNTPKSPEHSLLLRQFVFAAMLIPLVALVRTGGVGLLLPALLASIGMGVGHWYSYRHREEESKRWVRGVTFLLIHVILCWMVVGLMIGASYPQAQLAIFVQAVTSFDLRYRRSLFNTLLISMTNLYIAATISRNLEFALYLILFGILVLAVFFVAEQEDGKKEAHLLPVRKGESSTVAVRKGSLSLMSRYALLTSVAIFVIFLFTPRFASRPFIPPFSIAVPIKGGVKSEIINPGVPLVQVNGWSDETSDYYYGFDTDLDLRYRGGVSDDVVMYVNSPSQSYWRSHSYDFYDGITWRQSDKSLETLKKRRGNSVLFEIPFDERGVQEPIVQTFTIVSDQPNLIFAAYRPAEVYIMARWGGLSLDQGEGIRASEPLRAGTTYSVVSYRPNFNPELLRQAPTDYPSEIAGTYLQLPDNISERVRQLARDLTAPHDNTFDQVMALNEHLLTYPYNFFPPPHPPGAETVDTFLFEDKEGICEHYTTALVVMARSLGIPARLVAGYGSGDYNPITNYYEVRRNHAHAWAEVYFPDYGWVPFDPTPGWTPQPYPTPVQQWFFSAQSSLELNLPLAAIAQTSLTTISYLAPYLTIATLLAALAALTLFLKRRYAQWQAAQPTPYTKQPSTPERQTILKHYRRALKHLTRQQHPARQTSQSMSEYAHQMASPALSKLTEMANIAAYRPAPPNAEEMAEAERALSLLRDEDSM